MRPRFQLVQHFLPHQLDFDAARVSDVDMPMDKDPGRVVDDPSLKARLAANLAELQSDGRMSASRRPLADERDSLATAPDASPEATQRIKLPRRARLWRPWCEDFGIPSRGLDAAG